MGTSGLLLLSGSTLEPMNSMSVYCLIFSHAFPLAVLAEILLVETHNDTNTKQAVATQTEADKRSANEADHKSVGSNKVGQDYSSQSGGSVWQDWDPDLMEASEDNWGSRHHGCWKCRWKKTGYCTLCRRCQTKELKCKTCRKYCKKCKPCSHTVAHRPVKKPFRPWGIGNQGGHIIAKRIDETNVFDG